MVRRNVASCGAMYRPVPGSRRAPRTCNSHCGASVAHSPIAVNEPAPARTATAAIASTAEAACRTPRGRRGSGRSANTASRSRHRTSRGGGQDRGGRLARQRGSSLAQTCSWSNTSLPGASLPSRQTRSSHISHTSHDFAGALSPRPRPPHSGSVPYPSSPIPRTPWRTAS